MTPGEFRRIRQKLGIDRDQLGRILGISERSIRFYESEISNKPPGPNCREGDDMARRWNADACIGWSAIGLIAIFAGFAFYAFVMRVPQVLKVMMS